jgi:hypothetical protein
MQTIIWAIGAMLLLLLTVSFLPLDFNLKGKFAVVLVAFVIALGGLASVNFVPLWQILLIVLVLTFFVAYMMESRLGNVLYKSFLPEEELMEEMDIPFSNRKMLKETELDLLDLEEMGLTAPISISNSAGQPSMEPESLQVLEDAFEEIDTSFLQDLDKENQVIEDKNDLEMVDGYLSEIENMLLEDSEEKDEIEEDSWLDELDNLDDIVMEESKKEDSVQDQFHSDDADLELLIAFNEVAVGTNEGKINLKKEPELQK